MHRRRGFRHDRQQRAGRDYLGWSGRRPGDSSAPRHQPAQGRPTQGVEARDQADCRWSARGKASAPGGKGRRAPETRAEAPKAAREGCRAGRRPGRATCGCRRRPAADSVSRRIEREARGCADPGREASRSQASRRQGYGQQAGRREASRGQASRGQAGRRGYVCHQTHICEVAAENVHRVFDVVANRWDAGQHTRNEHTVDILATAPEVPSTEC